MIWQVFLWPGTDQVDRPDDLFHFFGMGHGSRGAKGYAGQETSLAKGEGRSSSLDEGKLPGTPPVEHGGGFMLHSSTVSGESLISCPDFWILEFLLARVRFPCLNSGQ